MLKRFVSLLAILAALLASTSSGAVVGGHPADPGEYPWTAAIYRGQPDPFLPFEGQFCGGSLVAPKVVVTAKHCVTGLLQRVDNQLARIPLDYVPLSLGVLVGETSLRGSGGERIRVQSISGYEDPNSDVAVLVLQVTSTVTPVAVASPSDAALYPEGTMATVTGWGATSERGFGSDDLLEAQVPIISDALCAKSYPGQIIDDTMICAGYPEGGTDTCQGDSGGPLVVPKGDDWLLVGTTWFGEGCARPDRPGVYSEVAPAWEYINRFNEA